MDSLLAAFGLVFIAELGDKTQLVALGLGARHKLGPVLAGVATAYALTNLVSVVIGGALGAALPARAIALGGGVLFLGFAAWTVRDGGGDEPDHAGDSVAASRTQQPDRSVFLSVTGAMLVAELGDKTMLTTATLAARGDPVLTWIGATLGITASGALGVLVGRAVGVRLPERATRLGSAVLFTIFGVGLIVTNL